MSTRSFASVRRSIYPSLAVLAVMLVGLGCSKPSSGGARGGEAPLRVAAAANFAAPIDSIAKSFEQSSGYRVEISTGSSGKLYAQIENGAPFDMFLSADEERPRRLEQNHLAEPGSRFTYAFGRLALYGKALKHPSDGKKDLESAELDHLAIANPKTAPYGAAAKQVLEKLELWTRLESRIVQGENVAQTYQFVASGAAELGLVALSSIALEPKDRYWLVPESLHAPIRQDAVLLTRGARHPAARAFLSFLKGDSARAIIENAGHRVP